MTAQCFLGRPTGFELSTRRPLGTEDGTSLQRFSAFARSPSKPSLTNETRSSNSLGVSSVECRSSGSRHLKTGSIGPTRWYWSLMAYVYGRTGQLERAQRALEKLEKLVRRSPSQSARTLELNAYLGLGQKEEAIALLQKAYAEHSSLTTLKVNPAYDPLRSDARFQELLRRVGLAQ